MQHQSTAERIGRREGRREGRKEGREEGLQEGLVKGELIGELNGTHAAILAILEYRFGTVPTDIATCLTQIDDLNRLRDLRKLALSSVVLPISNRCSTVSNVRYPG